MKRSETNYQQWDSSLSQTAKLEATFGAKILWEYGPICCAGRKKKDAEDPFYKAGIGANAAVCSRALI